MANADLSFLERVFDARIESYKSSPFLHSSFEADFWRYDFGSVGKKSSPIEIDFNIRLLDSSLLTDSQNASLLNLFKYWLNCSIHPDSSTISASYSAATARHTITKNLQCIDYFLLNGTHFHVHRSGLSAVLTDDMRAFADRFFSEPNNAFSVYEWDTRLTKFCLDGVSNYGRQRLTDFIEANPNLELDALVTPEPDEDWFDIHPDLLPLVKAFFWLEGFYCSGRGSPSSKKIAAKIYGEATLWGAKSPKPMPNVLRMAEGRPRREFPAAPVQNRWKGSMAPTNVQISKRVIRALDLLRDKNFDQANLPLPTHEAVCAFSSFDVSPVSNRFATVPSSVILEHIRNAIELHLELSQPILKSVESMLGALASHTPDGQKRLPLKLSDYLSTDEFVKCLDSKVRDLGVIRWGVPNPRSDFFQALRSNESLGYLVRIYFGAVALVLGAIMARRDGELKELEAGRCLDKTGSFLIFRKAKSSRGIYGLRDEVARPIDRLAADMVETLESIQNSLVKNGFIDVKQRLFDCISIFNPNILLSLDKYPHNYYQCVDLFCDYFESPCNAVGQRYYIRQHQLRRFFALSFFWGSGFGGMDTLRWFLGHSDPEHLYQYITESSPGKVLIHAKSQYLAETINDQADLQSLIAQRYGAREFLILEADELEFYIAELLENGAVTLEPDFFEDNEGKKYKLVVSVRGHQ